MRGKPSELHQNLIGEILRDFPDASTADFHGALRRLREEIGADEQPDIERAFRPDAYRFDREGECIEIYEVEITCELSDVKIDRLGAWWFDWDCEDCHDWLPVLITVDRYGHRNRVDLMHAYHRTGPFLAPSPPTNGAA